MRRQVFSSGGFRWRRVDVGVHVELTPHDWYRHLEQISDGTWRNNGHAHTQRDLIEQLDRREIDFEFRYGERRFRIRKGVKHVEELS